MIGKIQAYDKAIEIDPNYANAWRAKGRVFVIQGKYYDAIKAYYDAIC